METNDMIFGVVVGFLFLFFIGFMIFDDTKRMEYCVEHGGSWVQSSCLMDNHKGVKQ